MNILKDWLLLLKRDFGKYNLSIFQKDLLASLTVTAVALPLALAFGVASGASAAAGLVTAVLAGVLIGVLSGAPYQVSGPTGAMSAVLIVLAAKYGLPGVWVAGVMAGIMLVIAGIFKLGKIVALIPSPVISGFTSGIAVIIAFGQIDNALGIKSPASETIVDKLEYYFTHDINYNIYSIILTIAVIVIMFIWPTFKKFKKIPGSLIAILITTLIVVLADLNIPTIGNIPRSILLDDRLELFNIPWKDITHLIVPAMSIAALGAIESLLCGAVAGNMTGVRLFNSVELVAQGIGNIIIPFFGGVPATAAIARTGVNIKSGGVTRVVSILHGIFLMLIALLLAPFIGRVPMAALAGVLIVTSWRMNEWKSIRFFFSSRLKHAIVAFLITFAATVLLDLTQAILIGFGISTIIFMSQISTLEISRKPVAVDHLKSMGHKVVSPEQQISVYYLTGPLFFAAARRLVEEVEANDKAGNILVLSVRGVPLIDATGIEVLQELLHRQREGGGEILISGLQRRAEKVLRRSGFTELIGEDSIFWSADQAILSLIGAGVAPVVKHEDESTDTFDDTLTVIPYNDNTDSEGCYLNNS